MAEHPFEHLQQVPRGSRGVANQHHLVYSRRWLAAAALTGLGGAGALIASLPPWRRRGGRQVVQSLAGLGAFLTAAGLAGVWALRVEEHAFKLAGWPAALHGLTIGHLSDFHLGPSYSRAVLARSLAVLREARPDIICLTGDFVRAPADLPLLRELLKDLWAPLGVYACLGNHDYWDDPAAVALTLHELGVTVLVNGHRVVERDGARFVVAGVADPWQSDADLGAALDGAPAGLPVLLLAHGPDFIKISAGRVALQLSGHAHAGHVNLPWLGPLVLPRWGVEYPHGPFRVDRSQLYVSRGLGGLPVRLGALPEVAILTALSDERRDGS